MTNFKLLREKLASLPVHGIIDRVVADVTAGIVTIVAASTGSGKSMILPGALADASGHRIIVLAPRRFLVRDAAFNVAELAEIKIGEQVGYALGQMDGESSLRSHETKLLYCSYGYAISSGLINKAETIVLDEVHEADEYISLARAILRERKIKDPSLRILEMSATVNAAAQARYWQDIAKTSIHTVEGKALACEIIHEPVMLPSSAEVRTIEDIAVSLLEQGRKGIVVFRPGVREVENTVATIKKKLLDKGVRDVEVCGIHGGTPSDERRTARSAPPVGMRKVIVGTNVIESGVNLRWLDAGISDGYRKIPYHRDDTGANALVLEEQPQSGLLQQIGRINRDPAATGFASGLFILHAKKPFELRHLQNGPAIQRECLNDIAFHAASLGYDPIKLTWDITSTPHLAALKPRFEQAKQELQRLHLINDDWSLTNEGTFIKHLPVSPETGAMLCEAKRLDEQRMRDTKKPPRVMRDIVVIAAVIESHGLRKDSRHGHKGDQYKTSDLLDGMNAFRALHKTDIATKVLAATEAILAAASEEQLAIIKKEREELQVLCLAQNVSLNGFVEVSRLSDEIVSRLGQRDSGLRIDARDDEDKYDAERYGEVQRCILNANANRVFIQEHGGLRDLLRDFGNQRNDAGQPFNGYELGSGSIVTPPKDGALMVGSLREVQNNKIDGQLPLIVLTQVTAIPNNVFIEWATARADAYQPILSECTVEDGKLRATYAGQAEFEIDIPTQSRAQAKRLVDGH